MIVAIPNFNTRVSPRFDCALTATLVTVENNKVVESREIDIADWNPVDERIRKFLELGVGIVVCGGISCWSIERLEALGVSVVSGITGEVMDAISCLLRGKLESRMMLGGGGRCRGRWRSIDPDTHPGFQRGNNGQRGQGGGSGNRSGRKGRGSS